MTLFAQLYDADDQPIPADDVRYTWKIWGSTDGSGATGQTYTITSVKNAGVIYECTAHRLKAAPAGSESE